MSQYPQPPSKSNRWESSKPPTRPTTGNTSASGGGRSRPISAAAINQEGDTKQSYSDSDSDADLSLSITKLPPINRSSNVSSSVSSRSLSRVNLYSSRSSKSSISSRPQSVKKVKAEQFNIDYKESVGASSIEEDLLLQAGGGTKPEVLLKSNDLPIATENTPNTAKKSTQKPGKNDTKDTGKRKPVWGAKAGGKLVSQARAVITPKKSGKGLDSGNADKSKKMNKAGKRIGKAEQEVVPIIQIPQEESLKKTKTEGEESQTIQEIKENTLDVPSTSLEPVKGSKSHSSNSSADSDSDSSSDSSSSESSSEAENEESPEKVETQPLEAPVVAPDANTIVDEVSLEMNAILPEEVQNVSEQVEIIQKIDTTEDFTQKANPLTKLNLSQYNLFSNTAGAFRGPGDVYYKFVLGGKSVRPGAKKMKKIKIQEVELGKLDEILVEKAKHQTTLWNHKSVSKLREKHKEYLNTSITEKVISLEQTRAYIITTIHSINSFKKLLLQLTEQNERLQVEHAEVIASSNKKVSDTLAKNEDFVEKILKLEKEKILERKKAIKEFGDYMKICESHTSELEMQLEQKQNALSAKIHDMEDLKEFERASFEDPAITEKRLAREVESKQLKLKSLEEDVQLVNNKFPNLVAEFDELMKERGSAIFEASLTKFSKYVATVSQNLKDQNFKHKNEIEHQEKISRAVAEEIEFLKAKAIVMKKESTRQTDDRRNVFRLQEFMTCSPDMDIILKSELQQHR